MNPAINPNLLQFINPQIFTQIIKMSKLYKHEYNKMSRHNIFY